jgi:hypothetical protein
MNISPNPDPGAGMESALKKIQESAKTVNPGELKPDEKTRRGRVAGKKATPTPGTGVALPMAQPDPAIAEIIKIPFDIWSNSQNLKELKLKNDEALNLSRPVKTLLDHYLPQVSPVGYVWISFALIMTNTLSTRMMIVSNERTKRKKDNHDNGSEGKREVNTGKTNPTVENPPVSL